MSPHPERARLRAIPVRASGDLLGTLYIQSKPPTRPEWASYFDGVPEVEELRLTTQSSAAVFIVNRARATFAVTFGFGQRLLRDGICDERFGLRVTLNSIDPGSIQSIGHKRLDAITRLTNEQLSRKAD